MSPMMTPPMTADLTPLEISGPGADVPSLDRLYDLTAVPDRRVVFRGVNWAFYEELVDSIPESSNIHVDYDGRDLEVMGKGPKHETSNRRLGRLIDIITEEWGIRCTGLSETTWKRRQVSRGLESDQCYYFLPEKLAQEATASKRGSDDVADYPNPDLAIEVDISPPQVDRAGIYAALRVAEVWRFEEEQIIIERLTSQGTYAAVDSSGFLPVRAEEIRHWIVEEDLANESAWILRLQAEMKKKARRLSREARRRGEAK